MNKTGINWSGFNVKSAFPAATDEKWVKGEPVEISQPVQITVRPQSSDISRIWWMRKKKKQVSLARSQLGESLLVSESVQSGSHSSTGLLTLIISVGFVQILQCSSDYCPCAWAKKKKRRENQVEMGKGRLYLSVNFVQISTTVLKTRASSLFPPFRVKQTVEHPSRMSNLSPSSVRESDIPPPPSSGVILSSPPPSLHTKHPHLQLLL